MAGATSQMLSLWMDLVRQAFPGPTSSRSALPGLTAGQLNALDCIGQDGITMSQLARALRVTESSATALVDRLLAAGAISRERDAFDRRLVRVVVTEAGQALATRSRQDLEEGLERLLGQLEPSKLIAITLAMSQLGDRDRALGPAPATDDQASARKTEESSPRTADGPL